MTMANRLRQHLLERRLRLSALTGPIFDKELRVSSRRSRNYWLRFVYLAVLTVVVALVWFDSVRGLSASPYSTSQMAKAGMTIIATIIAFQFFTTQVLAVIMLSNAISDEIYHQTLGLLMTTSISSLQIVMGKLFSKLLQLVLLIAISMPLLAIIRVFGGVPWGFLVASLSITLTAVVFAGSLSLASSISGRRAYIVIMKTIFILGVLYAFFPAILGIIFQPVGPRSILITLFCYLNPFAALMSTTATMFSASAAGVVRYFYWPIHCIIMLLVSSLLLAWAVHKVRRMAIRQATGQLGTAPRRARRSAAADSIEQPASLDAKIRPKRLLSQSDEQIRPVKGSPMIWKELRSPFIQGGRKITLDALLIIIIVLIITYAINARHMRTDVGHMTYGIVFFLLGLVYSLVVSAACITAEKETRSWPLLLATSLEDKQILVGKAVGVFWRCLPVWFFLGFHVLLFTVIGCIHPIGALHIAMLMTWVIIFVSGAGLYFSVRFRRTTAAVIANVALSVFLWGALPALLGGIAEITRHEVVFNFAMCANPVIQVDVTMDAAGGVANAGAHLANLAYRWPAMELKNAGSTTIFMLESMLAYSAVGLLFFWRAARHIRRRIF
jgi:ABC-type transport system involved in multi-copper enzyme maturation permease subunit